MQESTVGKTGVSTEIPNTCFSYDSGICLQSLQSAARSNGINTTSGSVMVQRNLEIGDINPDSILTNFISLNHPAITEECRNVGLPFLCHFFHPICNPNDGSVITISEEQCNHIADIVCPQALELAKSFNLFDIPDCSTFNSDTASGMQMDNITEATNSTTNDTTAQLSNNITCHPEFDVHCGRCVPNCYRFFETSKDRQKLIDIFFIIAALICAVGGIFVIIVSILRRDVM